MVLFSQEANCETKDLHLDVTLDASSLIVDLDLQHYTQSTFLAPNPSVYNLRPRHNAKTPSVYVTHIHP